MLLISVVTLSIIQRVTSNSLLTENYVTTNKVTECLAKNQLKHHCLTLQEYGRQPGEYFGNNTIFYFEPGGHLLSNSLKLAHLHNFTFQGLPDNGLVVIIFDALVNITWENCSNITISSIVFTFSARFTVGIMFSKTLIIQLYNTSVANSNNTVNGYSSIEYYQSVVVIWDCNFIGIQGLIGAAMYISESIAVFIGNNVFTNNTATYGGSLYLLNSIVLLNGTNSFVYNNATTNSSYTEKRNRFVRGSGGAIYSKASNLTIINASIFVNNSAQYYGGAIAAEDGHIVVQGSCIIHFERNAAPFGGAVAFYNVTSFFSGRVSFINNKAAVGGTLMMHRGGIQLGTLESGVSTAARYRRIVDNSNHSFITFLGNTAREGGTIKAISSAIFIVVDVNFTNNRAQLHGGAIFLDDRSKLVLSPAVKISFTENHAESKGGALYVEDSECSFRSILPIECFFSIYGDNSNGKVLLRFVNNTAGSVGSTLYGGQLNKCRLYHRTNYNVDKCGNKVCSDYSDNALGAFKNISQIIQVDESQSAKSISSQVTRIKFCQLLNDVNANIRLYPGEQFNISVIALGQNNIPVPTTIFNQNEYEGDDFRLRPSSRSIILSDSNSCASITFQLLSIKESIRKIFKLYPKNPCQGLVDGLRLQVDILACPIGFELKDKKCQCDSRLSQFTQCCTIHNRTSSFKRNRNNFWISQLESADTLIIHEYRCPLDYCKDDNDSVNVTLEDPSVQCDFNRNGILCGRCQKNFDLALGSLHCIPCNNNYHSALIIFFALAGVVLIALIFFLRLTVSVGTLNGLLFYANVIQANHQAYFPRVTTRVKFFTIFISWLNLDLGIETCFYDGMDIYAYSWLQFLFPFYLLLLVGCIILACRYSRSIAKRLGQNPVAVLATLLLMSFSKILQASIVPLSWTHLVYYTGGTPSNDTRSVVWLYDASIQFFKEPKHTALGLFSITSLTIFVIPYIFLLVFGHWLQGCSNWWILSWLNKIKPFMDAYHAPYRKHTRYWTGLLLLSRLGLFLTFAINANGSESVNLVAVSSVTLALLAIQRKIYEQRWKDLLESFFILNLGIFSVATFYLKEESKNASQFIVSSISVGITFISFMGILTYHICLVFKTASSLWKFHLLPLVQKSHRIFKATSVSEGEGVVECEEKTELHTLPTFSDIGVNLREPLLEPESESQIRAATY
jgi:predicted outer membrane repeat protein